MVKKLLRGLFGRNPHAGCVGSEGLPVLLVEAGGGVAFGDDFSVQPAPCLVLVLAESGKLRVCDVDVVR